MKLYNILVSISAHVSIIAFGGYVAGVSINYVMYNCKMIVKLRQERNELQIEVQELQRKLNNKENYETTRL